MRLPNCFAAMELDEEAKLVVFSDSQDIDDNAALFFLQSVDSRSTESVPALPIDEQDNSSSRTSDDSIFDLNSCLVPEYDSDDRLSASIQVPPSEISETRECTVSKKIHGAPPRTNLPEFSLSEGLKRRLLFSPYDMNIDCCARRTVSEARDLFACVMKETSTYAKERKFEARSTIKTGPQYQQFLRSPIAKTRSKWRSRIEARVTRVGNHKRVDLQKVSIKWMLENLHFSSCE